MEKTNYKTALGTIFCLLLLSSGIYAETNVINHSQAGFVENKGQIADANGDVRSDVLFKSSYKGVSMFFKKDKLVYLFNKYETVSNEESRKARAIGDYNRAQMLETEPLISRLDLEFIDANPDLEIIASGEQKNISNYYLAHCPDGITGVKHFSSITYKNIYHQIDIKYYFTKHGFKYDIIVHPGGKLSDIQLLYNGTNYIEVLEGGELKIEYAEGGEMTEDKPIAFFKDDRDNQIEILFTANNSTKTIGFSGETNTFQETLIIDPAVVWSTYFFNAASGETTSNNYTNPEFDVNGNFFFACQTYDNAYPTLNPGGGAWYDASSTEMIKIIVQKFNPDRVLLWSTYYGGDQYNVLAGCTDYGKALALDDAGDVYVAGYTTTNTTVFPTYNPGGGAFYQDESKCYGETSYFLKFSTDGIREWATIFQHENSATNASGLRINSICSDGTNLYFSGQTYRFNDNDIPLRNPGGGAYYESTFVGDMDAFVGRFDASQNLVWSTYLNSGNVANTAYASALDVTCDENGNFWTVGRETGNSGTVVHHYITDPGGGAYMQATPNGTQNIQITKFNTSLLPVWSTYYGGEDMDIPSTIEPDGFGNIFIVGRCTESASFPVFDPGGGAYCQTTKPTAAGSQDSFGIKFDATSCSRLWASYFGGASAGTNHFSGLAFDVNGHVFFSGYTDSPTMTTQDQSGSYYQAAVGGAYDMFYIELADNLALEWATYYGGTENDNAYNGRLGYQDAFCGLTMISRFNTANTNLTTIDPGNGAWFQSAGVASYNDHMVEFGSNSTQLPVSVTIDASLPIICEGDSVTFTATPVNGGAMPTYEWFLNGTDVGVTDSVYTETSLSDGDEVYCILTSSETCVSGNPAMSDTITITVNSIPVADAGDDQTICSGSSATLTAAGGGSYLWSTGPATQSIIESPSVTTMYYVTVSENSCSAVDSVTIIVGADLTPTINATPPTVCLGQTTQLEVTGGTSFVWNTGATTQSIAVTPAVTTSYSVSVSDDNGCSGEAQIQIDVNDSITVIVNPAAICSGESTQLTASGGTSFYWNTGETTQTITVSPIMSTSYSVTVTDFVSTCSGSTNISVTVIDLPVAEAGADQTICSSDNATLVASGGSSYEWSTGAVTQSAFVSPSDTATYYVTVTDNSCSAVDSVTVNASPDPVAGIISTLPSVCLGQSAQLEAFGGTTYVWSTGATTQLISITPQASTSYSVTVSNNNGCSDETQIQIDVNDSIIVIVDPPTICSGDNSQLTASGGTTFLWNTGDTTQSITVSPLSNTFYSVTVTDSITFCDGATEVEVIVNDLPTADAGEDQSICAGDSVILSGAGGSSYEWSTGEFTNTITTAPTTPTTYFLTVTDNGCYATDIVNIDVTATPIANAGSDQSICDGSSANLIASGGDSYDWSTGDSLQTITVTPDSTTTYTVTVSTNNCSSVDEVEVAVNNIPAADAGTDQTICEGGVASLTATGGGSYLWSIMSTSAQISVSPAVTTTYYVTLTENNCNAVDSVTVYVSANVDATISATLDTVCQSQSTQLTAYGGSDYYWSTSDSTQTISITPVATTTYYVTVSSNGCDDVTSIEVTVNDSITAVSSPSEICQGESVMLSVSSGMSYMWSTNEITQTITVSPNSTTTYHVTVSANGCTDSTDVLVTVHPNPTASAGNDQEICNGESVTLNATGGDSYVWSNYMVGSSITISPQTTNTYSVTVSNAEGCMSTDNMVVIVNQAPVAEAGVDQTICLGDFAPLVATGGSLYAWSPATGLSSTDIQNPFSTTTVTTTYIVTVYNSSGCFDTDDVTVTVNETLTTDVTVISYPSESLCFGEEVTFVASSENAGTNPVYQWTISGLSAGTNSSILTSSALSDGDIVVCTLVSSEACVLNNPAVDSVQVSVLPLPSLSIYAANNKGCMPLIVSFSENGSPVGAYSYYWDFGDNNSSSSANPIHEYNYAGNYDVSITITSADGCSNTQEFTNLIQAYSVPEAIFYADPVSTSMNDPLINFINSTEDGYIDYCYFGDGDSILVLSPNDFYHSFNYAGSFTPMLVSHSKNGCTDTAYTDVLINPVITFYAPTAFIPDTESDNNIFYIVGTGIDIKKFELSVYDRWGELVFNTNEYNPENPEIYGWNGKAKKGKRICQNGVYSWLAIYYDINGTEHIETGSVTLIR